MLILNSPYNILNTVYCYNYNVRRYINNYEVVYLKESLKMKKKLLLSVLALSSIILFVGCSYANQLETSTEPRTNLVSEISESTVLDNIVNTKWILTDGTAGNPVNGNIITGENLTDAMNLTLEFKENGKVLFYSKNNNPEEYMYSHDYSQKDECCFFITGKRGNNILAHIQDNTMTFQVFNTTLVFTKQQ